MTSTDHVIAALASHGLLLTQDKVVPSVVGILTGESPSASWWSHPKAHLIFSVLSELRDHPDVLLTKLLFRKDTFVHRSLWPALLAVASARDTWQLRGLSHPAADLLDRIKRGEGAVHSSGLPVKELLVRLLAVANEIHTESGRHEMDLVSWQAWSNRVHCVPLRSVPDARTVIEQAAMALGASSKALPWPSPRATRRR